jgi:transcriptional regulator with XRE-family HTH domain
MPADPDALSRLADLIRTTRLDRGWGQEELANASGVSRPTIQRYEQRKTAVPAPQQLRSIFKALDLDPRRIPVILGYTTASEMGLPPESGGVADVDDVGVRDIIDTLQDPNVDPRDKADLVALLRFRVSQIREAAERPSSDRRAV